MPTSEQEHVQEQQEHEPRVDVRLRPLDELRRDLREDQVVGQAGRNSQDQQDAADECDAVGGHAEDVRPRRQVPVDVSLHDQRVERGDRRGLDERRDAADERSDDENRAASAPTSPPTTRPVPRGIRNGVRSRMRPDALADSQRCQQPEHQQAREQAADEEIVDRRLLRDDAVEHQRQREREEQAERAGRGEQADREPLAIAACRQRRQQQTRRAPGS